MKYLNDYFYIDLSQQAHLGVWGLAKRGPIYLDEVLNDPQRPEKLKKNKYAQLGQSVVLVLGLTSEIEAHFNFGRRQQAQYVWGFAAPAIVVVEEMYEKRYRDLLS